MSDQSGFLANLSDGDINYYAQIFWIKYILDIRLNGYVKDSLNEFAVTQKSSPGMGVQVDTGSCWIQGDWYQNDAIQNVTLATADATYPRIDRIAIRNYINGPRLFDAIAITGTPAAVPESPDWVRTDDSWDLIIAEVLVTAGLTTILDASIIDTRSDPILCGISTPRNVNASTAIPLNDIDLDGFKIQNIGLCEDPHDCSTYEYAASKAITLDVGYVCWYAGPNVPAGWLELDGSVFSEVLYPALYAHLGTNLLPDARGRSIMGYDATQTEFNVVGKTGGEDKHVITGTELPAHYHSNCYAYPTGPSATAGPGGGATITNPIATTYAGSSVAHENRMPFIVLKHIIKAVP